MMLDKGYNQGTASTLTRLAVSQGAPNKWGIDEQGNFYPEFVSEQFFDVMKLFRRLYEEKLINQDFAVVDSSELNKVYESGRANIRISGGNGQSRKPSWRRLSRKRLSTYLRRKVQKAFAFRGKRKYRLPGNPEIDGQV